MRGSPPIVLVVEDNAGIREVVREELESQGMEVLTASSGEEALMLLESRRMDVAIMDMKMPGMSGIETAIVLRGQHPNVPVILCTVCEEWRVREHIGREIYAYLPKPFTLTQLVQTVQRALEA